MTAGPPVPLERRDVYRRSLVDGQAADDGPFARAGRRLQRLLVTRSEHEEAALEQRLRSLPGVSRANTVALISPKGGVGKTSMTFVAANLLASHLKLRVVAVDANPDFGTLARLAPDDRRCERGLDELLRDADRLHTAAELGPYVTRLATGLHVLGAPRDPEVAARLGPDRYGELVAFLSCFYEVVLLDLGTGVVGPLARFAVERADQLVVVTTPEWVTSVAVLEALAHLHHERTTVAVNKAPARPAASDAIEQRFRAERLHRAMTFPFDAQLATMLDSGTYALEALRASARVAIKRLGLAVAEQMV
jgi:MinD-like ATPase involved in chromosome partitioning or flagellar assembly